MSKSRTERSAALGVAPSDDDARKAIAADLDSTVLVEAAAGTGKTRSLVDRMVALVATGRATVDRISAVTFTIRAAAALRQRFQNALERAVARERESGPRARLTEALSHVDSCFVGTIHAFCARLLRERPVEAGIEPGFAEMDEAQNGVAREEAWGHFTERLFVSGDPRLARLIELGIPLADLSKGYEDLCENSDLEPVSHRQPRPPDFAPARARVFEFLDRVLPQLSRKVPADELEEAIRRADRLRRLLDPARDADFVRILRVLKSESLGKGAPRALREDYGRLVRETVRPALEAWGEFVHPDVMAVLVEARDGYASWRRRNGRLNFQDLLVYARNLLRDFSQVRRELRERFTPILVDEFQDTDPIQAEILFYLTASDEEERDWTKVVPVPGSLFVVGDPKQSIYRFRRADIEIYDQVRKRLEACGRKLVLSTNFRSSAPLCEWVNGVFGRSGFFPPAPSPEQPAYVPLSPNRKPGPPEPCVYRLETAVGGSADGPLAELDAARLAAFVAGEIGEGRRDPGDFLILFRRRKFMTAYARALERSGVPCEIVGGAAFGASEELGALLPVLQALADPDDPVPLLAALRGALFGIDDEALYRFVAGGGRFHFRSSLPAQVDPRIARAWQLFEEGDSLTQTLPPGAAISRLLGRLGAPALAASGELGTSRAGNLLKAVAAARKLSADGLDFPAVVAEIDRLRREDVIEQMSLEPGQPHVARLMTLHGAKGLEAPVVCLADPTGKWGGPRNYVVDREATPARGHFRVCKRIKEFRDEEIARPRGWREMQEIEKRFEEAERIRSLYVAATRARDLLVVSIRQTAGGKASGTWAAFAPFVKEELPEGSARPVAAGRAPLTAADFERELSTSRRDRAGRLARAAEPSYATLSVTALSHADSERPAWERTGKGMAWGRVLHRLLEAVMSDPTLPVETVAANLLADEARRPEDLEEAVRVVAGVRASPLWRRALAAQKRLVEVPFAIRVPGAEIAAGVGNGDTLLQGAIDLVFEEEERWVVVDYKSDIVSKENRQSLVDFYRPQVEHYRKYWEKLTGKKTIAGLYFIHTGEEVWL
jgi:ATP-dependent helicase/nuclease subunit A